MSGQHTAGTVLVGISGVTHPFHFPLLVRPPSRFSSLCSAIQEKTTMLLARIS
jgi:hypothetical protein